MSTIMETRTTRIAGNFVAECPRCHQVCAYWDDEDLDEFGDLLCYCDQDDQLSLSAMPSATCQHCQRTIYLHPRDGWINPEATGDDSIWRETCEDHDAFAAEHEPEETT